MGRECFGNIDFGGPDFDFESSLTFDMLGKDPSDDGPPPAQSSNTERPCVPGKLAGSEDDNGSISFSAFGSFRLDGLDGGSPTARGDKCRPDEEEGTAATSVASSCYETMTANESQSLLAALDLSVSELDLRDLREARSQEDEREKAEARAEMDRRVKFSRTAKPLPPALKKGEKKIGLPGRRLERTKSENAPRRVRWADEQEEKTEKRKSI